MADQHMTPGDNYLLISAVSGLLSYASTHLIQVHVGPFQFLTDIQPIFTLTASLVAIVAGLMSWRYHTKKMKEK